MVLENRTKERNTNPISIDSSSGKLMNVKGTSGFIPQVSFTNSVSKSTAISVENNFDLLFIWLRNRDVQIRLNDSRSCHRFVWWRADTSLPIEQRSSHPFVRSSCLGFLTHNQCKSSEKFAQTKWHNVCEWPRVQSKRIIDLSIRNRCSFANAFENWIITLDWIRLRFDWVFNFFSLFGTIETIENCIWVFLFVLLLRFCLLFVLCDAFISLYRRGNVCTD